MRVSVSLALLDASVALANILPRQVNSTTTTVSSSAGNATDLASASACVQSKYSWLGSKGRTIVSTTTYVSTTTLTLRNYSSIYDTLTFASNSTPSTLCDGWPRINGNTSISTSVTTFYSPSVSVSTLADPVYTSVPPPSCTVPPADCDALNSIYSVAEAAYNTSLEAYRADYTSSLNATTSFTITVPAPDFTISSPICGTPTYIYTGIPTSQVGDPTCFENFANIQLLYWPVTRIGGDCGTNTSTMTMAPTISGKPNTFEYWGSTLTSPTVYMAFDGTWVLSSNGITVSDQSRLIIPQSATAVTSLCAKPGGGYMPKRVNYADLNWPYNADAYRCQEKCYSYPYEPSVFNTTYTSPEMTILGTVYAATTEVVELDTFSTYATVNLCSTIWEQDFHPVISIPPEFSSLTPAGQDLGGSISCPFVFNSKAVFYDPPLPLTVASSVIGVAPGPTSSSTTTSPTSAAVPGSTASPSTPSPTSTPTTTPTAVPVELPPSTSTTIAAGTQPAAPETLSEETPTRSAPDTKSSASALLPSTSSSVLGEDSSAVTKTTATALLPSSRSSAAGPVESAAPNPPAQSEVKPPVATTTSQNIGGIIASVIGETSTPAGAQPSSAASAVASPADLGASSQGGGGAPSSAASSPAGVIFTFAPTAPAAGPASSGAVADPTATSVADPAPVFSAVGTTLVVAGTSAIVVAPSVTLTPGGAAVTVSGTTLSLASSATALVVDGSTQVAATPVVITAPTGPAVLTFGSNTLTAGAGGAFTVAPSVTLTPGGFVIVSGAILSLATAATAVVVDGVTQNLAPAPVSATDPAAHAIVLAGSTFTADPSSAFVLPGDNTLKPGGVVTVSGTTISLGGSASDLVVNGATQTLPSAVAASATPVLTLGAQTFTADPSGAFSLGSGTALAPGGAVTISGTVLSLPSSGGAVVVDGVTQTLAGVTGISTGTTGAAQSSLPAVTTAAGTSGVTTGGVSGGAGPSSTPATVTTSSADRPSSERFVMAGMLLSLFMICA